MRPVWPRVDRMETYLRRILAKQKMSRPVMLPQERIRKSQPPAVTASLP